MPLPSATTQRKPLAWPLIIGLVLVAGLIIAGLVAWNPLNLSGQDAPADLGGSSDPSSSASAAPACDPRFVQVELDRSNGVTEPRYESTIRPIINDTSLSLEEKTSRINAAELGLAGTNAQTLADWAEAEGHYPNEGEMWRELVDGGNIVNGGCLSEKGREIYFKMEGSRNAGGNVEIRELTEQERMLLTNSGINGSNSVVADGPGVYGDVMAIIRTLPDGTKVIRLVRCGNVQWLTIPPHKPRGHTDNPPPPTHENPPPDKPVCPWNPALPPDSPDCVEPKSSNPNDYRRPGDGGGGRDSGEGTKPLAPVTTVQPAPAPVEESRTGGGGIVDTPSNPPASESGVTAPEATPAPVTPSSPPPNEGGSNDGEVAAPSWG